MSPSVCLGGVSPRPVFPALLLPLFCLFGSFVALTFCLSGPPSALSLAPLLFISLPFSQKSLSPAPSPRLPCILLLQGALGAPPGHAAASLCSRLDQELLGRVESGRDTPKFQQAPGPLTAARSSRSWVWRGGWVLPDRWEPSLVLSGRDASWQQMLSGCVTSANGVFSLSLSFRLFEMG